MLYAVPCRGGCRGGIDLRLADIEQNGPDRIWFATLFLVRNDLCCPRYKGKCIPRTGLKYSCVDVDVGIRQLSRDAGEQGRIAQLALPLASEEDSPPLRYVRSTARHPICGTEPYTPDRYFL